MLKAWFRQKPMLNELFPGIVNTERLEKHSPRRQCFQKNTVSISNVEIMISQESQIAGPLAAPPGAVSAYVGHAVALVAACVQLQRGIVDAISADHVFSSFGAARPCGAQTESAQEWKLARNGSE